MSKPKLSGRTQIVIVLIVAAIVITFAPTLYYKANTQAVRYNAVTLNLQQIPKQKVALVFGAGVYPNGQPSAYLRWRVQTAAALIKAGRVQTLLLSGDNSTTHYNEPMVMQRLAIEDGVPGRDIVLDYAGYSTYDSCYRAYHIFGVRRATLVSQGYHIPRAIETCDALGVTSIGVAAVHPDGKDWGAKYLLREVLSTDESVLRDIVQPKPTVLGKPEPTLAS